MPHGAEGIKRFVISLSSANQSHAAPRFLGTGRGRWPSVLVGVGVKAPSRAGFQRTLGAPTEDAATSEKNMTVDIREESIGHLDQLAAISTALWFMDNRTGDPSFASTQNSNESIRTVSVKDRCARLPIGRRERSRVPTRQGCP